MRKIYKKKFMNGNWDLFLGVLITIGLITLILILR